MVILQFNGGLGNQMFEYALYSSFIKRGVSAKIDLSMFLEQECHNGYELERIFSIKGIYCTPVEKKIVKGLGKVLYLMINHPYKERPVDQYIYNSKVSTISFGFLKGYWQSEKYFGGAESLIRQKFSFPEIADSVNKETQQKIQSTNSVSLHIRRGDYLTDGRSWTLSLEYYRAAISYLKEKTKDPFFYIFSDDMEWAKEKIKESNALFINGNKGDKSYIDMQLMSTCKHNIIANSSFSWWGAWLNNNPAKIVIAPQVWMPGMSGNKDMIPNDWVLIPNTF